MTKSNDYGEIESSVFKIDSDGVIWKLQSSTWSIDNDYMDGQFISSVSDSYIERVGFTLLLDNECSSGTVSEILNMEYHIEENCSGATILEKSPYRQLPVIYDFNTTHTPFNLTIKANEFQTLQMI